MATACLQVQRLDFRARTPLPQPKSPAWKPRPVFLPFARWPVKRFAAIRCSVSAPPRPTPPTDGGGRESVWDRQIRSPDYGPIMKGMYGSAGTVTLEKGKLDMSSKQSKSSPELATGGGGGDIGKNIIRGGGGGDDDDGDDDNYFDDFDDGDEGVEGGIFGRRKFLKELFDRKFVDAVLNEWHKAMTDLPSGLRQACEMGLVSSAQLVRYLAMNARPTTARLISRSLPESMSRAFIGRMIADPAFLYRFLLEQAATIGFAVSWELKNRKDRIKTEWDLALINVLTASLCNAVVVWTLAPCRSYGNTFQYDLQNTLQKLPNNIFEKSYPLREFDLQKRIHSFCCKAAELCLVGTTTGAIQGSLSNFLAGKKNDRLSVCVPSTSSNAFGYGAFLGIYANLSQQLLCGADRLVTNHFDAIGVALFFGTALRIMNANATETLRYTLLGMEADPLINSGHLLRASSRPSTTSEDTSSSNWFISKDAFVSGFGLFGNRQEGTADSASGEAAAPKARRKRIVRKKVVAL